VDDISSILREYLLPIIFLLWFFRKLFRNQKQNEAPKQRTEARTSPQNRRPATATVGDTASQRTSFRDMIREAEERMQQAIAEANRTPQASTGSGKSPKNRLEETAFNTKASAQPSTPQRQRPKQPVAPSLPQEAPDSAFAFHSLSGGSIAPRTDYDLSDTAFAYHASVDEPTEQMYHQTGFTGFHVAQGLSHNVPASALSAGAQSETPLDTTFVNKLLNPTDLQQLIILKEILDKPRALR